MLFMSALDNSGSGQRDFDHASYKALLLHNPVYNQMCLHRSWILIYHCAGTCI
jgi:hypothetical protein